MNINIRNCDVNIISRTGTLEISGKAEPKTETGVAGIDGIISTQRTYTLTGLITNLRNICPGDRVRLPVFTVPSTDIHGVRFEEVTVDGYATAYDIDGGKVSLCFDRAVMHSKIYNNWWGKAFTDTPLGIWLREPLKQVMHDKGVPVEECGLLRREELCGNDTKLFFKDGRNRICFDKDGRSPVWYWTETTEDAEASSFCYVDDDGDAIYYGAGDTKYCVRPRFTIRIDSREGL